VAAGFLTGGAASDESEESDELAWVFLAEVAAGFLAGGASSELDEFGFLSPKGWKYRVNKKTRKRE
jgi:hypothetical protein